MYFLPDLPALAAFTFATIVLALTPGPDMTFFLSKAVANGRRAGLAAYAGAASGILVHTLMVAVGLSALLVASATAFTVLKVVGALYLLWLAIDALRSGSGFQLSEGGSRPQNLRRIYLGGFWINILNPKIILFFMTFLPQFVSTSDPDAVAKLIFLGLWFIAVATVVILPLIVFADLIAVWLRKSPRILRAIDWLFAGVMAGFAIRLALARGN